METIAAAALRARLRSHGGVSVRLRANGWDLLAGRVEGAAVEGRLWESPLGLTARILDVSGQGRRLGCRAWWGRPGGAAGTGTFCKPPQGFRLAPAEFTTA